MCGPSSEEQGLQKSSANMSSMLQQNYGTLFGEQQGVLSAINRSLSPTLAAGPNQHGFSADELAARNTSAINAAGAANRSAQQAARTYGAGQGGGGTSGVTSGITKQIQSAIGTQSADALASKQGDIVGQDFATGRDNYWRAQGGMDQLAAGYNPNAASSGAINANQVSFGEADKINTENNAMAKDIAGFATGAGMSMLTGGLSALGPNDEGNTNGTDFLKGMFGAA